MLGTRGVPANHGGFETAVEEVGARLVERGNDVRVYCRNRGQSLAEYKGMRLHNLPALRRKTLETLSHTGLSVLHATTVARPDVAIVFNAGNAPFLPILAAARIPFAVHLDGLEWQRAKWKGFGQVYYRGAERFCVRTAPALIADAIGIQDYVRAEYGADSAFIPYGAREVPRTYDRLAEVDVAPLQYHLVVARFEPENHVLEMVAGYLRSNARFPLLVVGSAPYSDAYSEQIRSLASQDPRIRLLGAVWDQEVLDQLYANCRSYLHGHSVGGTNPSLLRAMGAGAPVTAFDVVFNREVTGGHARFVTTPDEVAHALESDEGGPDRQPVPERDDRGDKGKAHALETYDWDGVAADYEQLCQDLLSRSRRRRMGRRTR